MKKQDNKGFTLIELLVAVMVLAIIIVPLLHSFVTSFRVNSKSKQLMRATTLAQNEMEIFEKEKIEDLKTMTDKIDPTKLVYNTTDGPDGCYTFKREKTINDGSGREMFDVVVTLNPERADSAERYYAQNTAEVMQMNTISNLDSGSYVQSIRSGNNAADYDTIVYGIFKERKNASGIGASWDIDDFEQKLVRRIIINVSQINDSLGPITKAKVTYEYTCEYGVMPDEYRTYTEETIMFDNAQSLDAGGNRIELKSLYLFYAPRYDTTKVDEIVIENEAKLPIDFYVVRQDIWKKTADEVRSVPLDYEAKISINDGLNSDGDTFGRYWTNLNLNEAEIEGNGKHIQLSLTNLDNPLQPFTETEIKDKTGIKKLGQTEAKDRIYTMEVKVYEAGANPVTEEPIVTMTGSKME